GGRLRHAVSWVWDSGPPVAVDTWGVGLGVGGLLVIIRVVAAPCPVSPTMAPGGIQTIVGFATMMARLGHVMDEKAVFLVFGIIIKSTDEIGSEEVTIIFGA